MMSNLKDNDLGNMMNNNKPNQIEMTQNDFKEI